MKMLKKITVFTMAAAMLSGAALAQTPRITTGAELVSACTVAIGNGAAADDRIARASCHQFLAGLVAGVYGSVDKGAPMIVRRLGPGMDEEVCFRLPEKLAYATFAEQVTSYAPEHPELYERSAFEMGARTLAANYPCPEQ
ncbi:Rap1a/Tai family immunity protein [Parvibaculum sp.]|uniref:Rap1a/Tai family immunity protein n=1 Tax=Parvibaculum sp. TaxID=2024848 RepID=UPI0027319378|nr:Rap1a/Tai family immunity protein [Parvibaculum sp.]MDP1627258.1 Rap1a/Tai family immunity protein [Parvibaculum sp.]MDP2148964.1 Rap1a/Tai family immunity protein [Parvibaculum sp.]MDP3327299.1 Rap1a/Tai family immunity protein [Parvibaculum sp.]